MKSTHTRAWALALIISPAMLQAAANLNPQRSVCLDLRGASSYNMEATCSSSNAECNLAVPGGGLQCTDNDGDPLNGAICVDQACYGLGATITVDLELGPTPGMPACQGQFYLAWDTATLGFASLTTNPDGELGWSNVTQNQVTPSTGTIDLVLGLPGGLPCSTATTGGGTVARIKFMATAECGSSGVWFRPHNPPTRVRSPLGYIPLVGCNGGGGPSPTDELTVQGAPVWTCPPDSSGHADCGSTLRAVTYPPPAVDDPCSASSPPPEDLCVVHYYPACSSDGDCPAGSCSGGLCEVPADPAGFDLSQYVDCSEGCLFLPGLTRISCSRTSACGHTAGCEFEVFNSGLNRLTADIELSPQMLPGSAANPISRCIDFELRFCGSGEPALEISQEVVFGAPSNPAGFGQAVLEIPPGNWDCVTARDPKHTLVGGCTISCVDGHELHTEFTGAPQGPLSLCHWLIQGNLDGDAVIDIVDFTILAGQYLNSPGASSPCGYAGFHGDINGDGNVTVPDVTFVIQNFNSVAKQPCGPICGPSGFDSPVGGDRPRREISVAELESMGLGEYAQRADLNHDGQVNFTDIALFLDLNPVGGVKVIEPSPPAIGD